MYVGNSEKFNRFFFQISYLFLEPIETNAMLMEFMFSQFKLIRFLRKQRQITFLTTITSNVVQFVLLQELRISFKVSIFLDFRVFLYLTSLSEI